MPAYLAAQNELLVGDGLVVEAPAGEGPYVVVFEDDEETGYFYALDTSGPYRVPVADGQWLVARGP
jgi:hypothetical protein